jgi:hypothetical protein
LAVSKQKGCRLLDCWFGAVKSDGPLARIKKKSKARGKKKKKKVFSCGEDD